MRKQAPVRLEHYQEALRRLTEHLRTPLFANAYALVVTTGANAVLGVLYWIAAARSYEAEVVGRNAALIAAMMFLGGLAQLNLDAIVIRFLPTIGRQAPRLIRGSYAATLSAALCASLIFLLGLGIWAPELGELRTSVALGTWFVFSTLSWSIFHLQDSVLTGLRQAVWIPVENIAFGVAKIVLLLALSNSLDQVGIFASWTIPAVFLLLPVNILIFRRLLPQHMKQNLFGRLPGRRVFARFLLGDYAGYLFFLSSTTLLPLVVTHQVGSEANAYFYQAWIIANSLMLVAMNVTASFTVEVARAASMLQTYGRRVFRHALKILGPAVIAVVVFAPYILSLFGERYAREGTATLRLLSLSALPSIVVLLGIAQARLQQRMVEVVVIQGTMSLLVLGLSIVLLDRLGIIGVGVAWLSSQLLLALILLVTRVRWLVGAPPTPSVG